MYDQFDAFAENYDWLYSDQNLTGEPAMAANEDVLAAVGTGARILDCSCGTGTLAIALARRGFAVSGADGSAGMIRQATRAAREAGVDVPFTCCLWKDLAAHFGEPFDVVFCTGNSICHAQGRDEMLESLRGMRAVVRAGGTLVIHSRNWERVCAQRTRFTHYGWRERYGQRCLPLYVWDFPERFEDPHRVEVVLVFDRGGEAELRSFPIVYHPFRLEQLRDCLRSAGFAEMRCVYGEGEADYRVIAS